MDQPERARPWNAVGLNLLRSASTSKSRFTNEHSSPPASFHSNPSTSHLDHHRHLWHAQLYTRGIVRHRERTQLTPGPSASSSTHSSSAGSPFKPKTPKKCIGKFPSILISNLTSIPRRRIRDNQYEFPSQWDVSLDARELVQQLLTPNLQGHPSLYDIVHHAFFTRGIVPGQIFASAWDMPPDFRHISPLVSRANLSWLREACQLDGEIAPTPAHDSEPPAVCVCFPRFYHRWSCLTIAQHYNKRQIASCSSSIPKVTTKARFPSLFFMLPPHNPLPLSSKVYPTLLLRFLEVTSNNHSSFRGPCSLWETSKVSCECLR
jgi:hypothetical protein